jgi:Cu(I)/Ag(I) efflux system membrane fusion protein
VGATVVAAFWACQKESSAESQSAVHAQKVATEPATPESQLTRAYIQLQTKLASDDLAGAKSAFAAVQSATKASGQALAPELSKRMETAAAAGSSATKIDAARAAFAALSDAFLAWFGTRGNPLSETLTVAFCPMALENKGSRWLQLGDKLRNPYFGAEMLTCGSVEGALKPGQKR